MGLFDALRKKTSGELERQLQEHLKMICSMGVEYELLETEDGDFFFVTDDSSIPHDSGSKYDRIIRPAQGRAGYHSIISIHELSRRKENPKAFGFLICPFQIRNNPTFAHTLGRLLQKSQYGKEEVFLHVFGRSACYSAQKNGHSLKELFTNTSELAVTN